MDLATITSLMTAGSFYYDENQQRLFVWLPNGNAPGTTGNEVIEASTAQAILVLKDYYYLKGLAVRHTNSIIDRTAVLLGKNCLVEECDIEWTGGWGINAHDNSKVTNCNISHNGQGGISGAAPNLVYRKCLVAGNNNRFYSRYYAAGGSKFGPPAYNCIIENCEFTGNYGTSVWFDQSPASDIVKYDSGTHTDITQITTVDSAAIIRNNYIHDNTGNPIYSSDSGYDSLSAGAIEIEVSRGAEIYNNVILRNNGYGITISDSSKCSVHDNIVASTAANGDPILDAVAIGMNAFHRTDYDGSGDWIWMADDNEIFDNIFLDNGVVWLDKNTTTTDVTVPSMVHNNKCDYNVYFRTGGGFVWLKLNYGANVSYTTLPSWSSAVGYDTHSYYTDPGFAAQGGLDVMLAHLGIINAPNPNASPAVAGMGLGCTTEAI